MHRRLRPHVDRIGRGTLAVALCAAVLTACDHTISNLAERRAPDGRHKAVVFTTRGGAESHTSVSVLPADEEKPGWPPNVFTALHHEEGSPEEGQFGGPKVTVRWVDARTLEISYDPRASTLRRHTEAKGVRVVYRVAEQEHTPFRGRRVAPYPPDTGS